MSPKSDIRSFFTKNSTAKKTLSGPDKQGSVETNLKKAKLEQPAETPDASTQKLGQSSEPQLKKSVFFSEDKKESQGGGCGKAESKGAARGVAKGGETLSSPSAGRKAKTRPGSKEAQKKQKRKRVLDSDEESDYQPDDAEGAESEEEVLIELEPSEDDEAEEAAAPARKRPREQPKPKGGTPKAEAPKRAKQETPRSNTPKKPKPSPAKKTPAKAAEPPGQSRDAKQAQEAVAAAIKGLPPKEKVRFSAMPPGSAWGQKPDDAPPNAGSKEVPSGHPDCLTGLTFVITGVLDSLKREEAQDLIQRHGGRVTGNVSKKTSFLLVGEQCGNSKLNKANELSVQYIDEDGLLSLIRAAPAPEEAFEEANGAEARSAPAKPAAPKGPPAGQLAARPGEAAPAPREAEPSGLWVDRHKPSAMKDLVGNGSLVGSLRAWLSGWHAQFLEGKPPAKAPSQSRKVQEAMSKRSVLLSGPPGIGKTTSAMLVCRELGLDPVEVNASDTRNTSDASALKGVNGKLANIIRELSTNTAMGVGGGCGARTGRRTVIVMDEVDGMSANDRGGIADLIKIIAKSKVPIICICNDKYSQKLKSLRNHTMELDFKRPTTQMITKRMLQIAQAEGLQVNEAAMNVLVEGANGDLRAILGQLQMVRIRGRSLKYDDAKNKFATSKDANISPFAAAQELLDVRAASLRLGDQMDLVFQDMDLVPLLLQENYLNHRPRIAGDETQRLMCIAKAADAFSSGDIVNTRVRRYQNWALMPFATALGSVMPAAYVRGQREPFNLYPGEPNFPRFTAWLGNNSTANKQKRVLGELHTLMVAGGGCTADRASVRQSYLPALRRVLTLPLKSFGQDAIEGVIQTMHQYCISREELDNLLDITKFKSKAEWAEDPMKDIPTATKSAFTRSFNKSGMRARTNLMVEDQAFAKGKRKRAAPEATELVEGDPEFGEEKVKLEADEKEEEIDPAALKEQLRRRQGMSFEEREPAGKGKGKGKAKAAPGKAGTAKGRSKGRGK